MSRAKLALKIASAAKAAQHVERDGVNSEQRYRYMSADQVASIVGSALFDVGVIALTRYELVTAPDARHETQRGGAWRYARVSCVVTLVDAETGESFEVQGFGDGVDPADKAILKAQTAAWRDTIKRLVFATSKEQSDPEADERTDREGALAPAAPRTESRAAGRTRDDIPQQARRGEDRQARPSPEDQRQSRGAPDPIDSSYSFAFGRSAGVPIKDLSDQDIDWYESVCGKSLRDPDKQRWRARTEAQLEALSAERERRALARARGEDHVGAGPDGSGDDDIPF